MEAARLLREKIESGDTIVTGVLATFHFWPGLVEIAMRAGLDYLIIDLEHLSHDASQVADACAIGRRENFPVLIRPAAAEFTLLRLAMDLGPCGLLVPSVESLADMRAIQDAVHLKPRGKRRPGGPGNLWVPGVNLADWRSVVEDHLIILPQIESRAALEQAGDIAAHPLTTAIAVGPYDLSADLGVCWDPQAPVLLEALERIRRAGRAAGKAMWMIGDGPALAGQGWNFLCIAEPVMLLQGQLARLNQETKGAAGAGGRELPLP